MSWLCDLALVAGMTLSGSCPAAIPASDPLPADDPAVWAYKPPAPPPAPPPPAPAFPPVVIEREVVREVAIPAPVQAPPPAPAPTPKTLGPVELSVQSAYRSRALGAAAWTDPVPLPVSVNATPSLRPAPLDLGIAAKDPTYKEASITSTKPVDNSRIVTTDRYISGIFETGINTQLDGATGGPVVIQTTRDVFGYHGRNILIPKGSRLVCAFKSLDKIGSTRAPLRCSRVLLGGHRAEIFGAKANVTDVQGALGVSGEVDNRFFERYGTAFLLAGISAAVRASTAGIGSPSSSSSSSALGSSSTYSDGGALSQGSAELSQRLGEITASALEQTINLTPILKVAQGTRIQIRPDTDWYIANVE
ncbi:TrbI/VirB10 family protein [Magnetospirillum molischianum]|uniref:Bacterial conjugation TrbI-like protein n=1 Tax=Magnetospirillum molischianum DSM 120 TaxID=1150626 RepID=H8FVV1_MAGML|nr:TrbI/VirB10 family protein [Magnetospirillum molischianum]CCG42489.1 Bacterial conjugation TrbI-like protein [Magnetospirillum molischianum DSM 120]